MQERGTTFGNVISLLAAFVATSVVMGLLGAGLMMPTIAATGAAARQGVAVFDALPGEFTQNPLSEQSRILASDGSLIATPYDENRIIVPLAQIAPIMRQAQIAIEDSRFYEHGGVDPQGVGRAFISNLRGGDTQGASTLTQQYVKITLQENALRNKDTKAAQAATARNYTRKLQELKYAVTLEKTLTKDQILQGYLNLVYYGGQAYGVEAASRHFFGIKASKLNLQQAATLAGLVQLPSQTDPIRSPARALARRNVVLDRMHTLGIISSRAWSRARISKMVIHSIPAQNSCALAPYPYFCNYIKSWLLEQPALGKNQIERAKRINRGGLTIQTTLDPKIQKIAQEELVKKVPIGSTMGSTDIGAATAVIEPGTGNVLAIAQNTKYALKGAHGKTSVNWAVDRVFGGSAGFAFGSTAKMFAVTRALQTGMTPSSIIIARKADAQHAALFFPHEFYTKGRPEEEPCKIYSPWGVHNDEGTRNGPITLTDALAHSVNTAFAGLVAKLGPCEIRTLMSKMGLHRGDGEPITTGPAAVTLGSDSVSPLTLASAYATVASGGIYCVPSPVLSITTADKKPLALPKNQCRRVLEPAVANGVTKILKTVLTNGTGQGIGGLAGKRPVAGKTGTAGNAAGYTNETWFVGYTPQLVTAVWVGTPLDRQNTARMRDLHLGGKTYGGEVFGATIAGPTWKSIMDRASVGMPYLEFGNAGGGQTQVSSTVPVPYVAGMSVSKAKKALTGAGFIPVVGGSVSSSQPQGRVVGTQPAGEASRGATVVIQTSNGNGAKPTTAGPAKPVIAPSPKPVIAPPVAPNTGTNTNFPNKKRLPKCRPNGPRPCRVVHAR